MTNRTGTGIGLLLLANVLAAGCDGADTSPTGPSAVIADEATKPESSIRFMKGTVSDTAFRELPGARVEVLDGPTAGASTIVDARGEFSFSGMFDETTQFRATSEGHVTAIRTLQPYCARCNPNWWINFTLQVLDPPVNVAGQYTLTFIADSTCTSLPDDVRTRSFTASIPSSLDPDTGYVSVTVGGALAGWDVIAMGVSGNYVGLWLETLVEQIAPNAFVSFSGLVASAVAGSTTSTIVLPFSGRIEHCVTHSESGTIDVCHQGPGRSRPLRIQESSDDVDATLIGRT